MNSDVNFHNQYAYVHRLILEFEWDKLWIGAKLGWFVIVDTRPKQADISREIMSS